MAYALTALASIGTDNQIFELVLRDDCWVWFTLDSPLVVAEVNQLEVVLLVVKVGAFSVNNAEFFGLPQNKVPVEGLGESDRLFLVKTIFIVLACHAVE